MSNELDELQIDDSEVEIQEDVVDDAAPAMGTPEWHDYVMSQLTPDEIDNGNPKVDGLRRLVHKLLGDIVKSVPTDQTVVPTNDGYKVIINHEVSIDFGRDGVDIRTFGAMADADRQNSDKPFDKFLAAIADTRAEGRALRRALQLKVVVAEELATEVKEEDEGPITATQITGINKMAERLNVNVEALSKSFGYEVVEINKSNAPQLLKALSGHQADASKIPEELVGYDKTWKDNLVKKGD